MKSIEEIRNQILPFEREAIQLDSTLDEVKGWMEASYAFSANFLSELPSQPANQQNPETERLIEPCPAEPTVFEVVFNQMVRDVLTRGLNASSGRYMAYVPGGGIPVAAIADFLAAITNRYSGNYGACPPAAEIENTCIRWLIDMVGLPKTSWGVLTSGGTLAALTGLVAARNTREPAQWHKGVVYVTSEVHHSISKVLATIGLGHLLTRQVAVDSELRMRPKDLENQIVADKKMGLSPWIVCATAGTTSSGAVDPLGEIAKTTKQNGLWLHVDGAYGGFFTLTSKARDLLRDMALADSLVLDPHKSLFLPYGIGAALVRDGGQLLAAFSHSPDYLKDLHREKDRSPSDFSIESTRHFRGLRMWLAIKLHGVERFRKALEEKLLLATYAYTKLIEMGTIETGPAPQLSIVTFRVRAESDEQSDALTSKLLNRIQSRAKVYLSSTRLKGKLYIRLCILNFRTHLEGVDLALQEIETLSQEVRNP